MYGIVYFADFSSLSLTVHKQQLQIAHESFHADRPTTCYLVVLRQIGTLLGLVIFTVNVLFYAELAILVRINAKMHYFEPES